MSNNADSNAKADYHKPAIRQKNDLTVKLLALYDLNKIYIDEAAKFLAPSSDKARNETLMQEDIDRLYSHISMLEHVAKLLHEEFLLGKNGAPPK